MSVRDLVTGSGDRRRAGRPSRGGESSGADRSPSTGVGAGGGGTGSPGPIGSPGVGRGLALGALLALAAWLALGAVGRFPFPGWLYHFAWYTALLGADAWLAARSGRAPPLGRPRLAISLWLWSVPVWLLFELLNLRVANWYYVFASPDVVVRRASAALAFATVLPAIYLGHRAVAELGWFAGVRGPTFRVGRVVRGVLFAAGLLFLALSLWRPALFFPLIWGATTLLIEPWNQRRAPGRSLLDDLARGAWTRPLRLLVAGAAIGLLWETFNAFAETRWIYTVPGLEAGKLFEMPVLGYLGFPVFALDCFVIYQALVTVGIAAPGWEGESSAERRAAPAAGGRSPAEDRETGRRRGRIVAGRWSRLAAWTAAALFSLAVLHGVDRFTVDSIAPPPAELAALDAEARRLARLRGIGTRNAAALAAVGIEDVCDLARASVEEVSTAVRRAREDPRAGRPARVRVWIRAAADACDAEPGAG